MAVTTADIIDTPTVRAIVEQETEQNYRWRQAFRNFNASNSQGDEVQFPTLAGDFEGDMVEIPEGSEYPRGEMSYGDVSAAVTKRGFEFAVTDEAEEDSVVAVTADGLREMVKEESRGLDSVAYNILANNQGATQGPNDGVLAFNEVVDARAYMRSEAGGNYDPDVMFVDPLGAADILKSDEFKLRDTPLGDRAVTAGFIGGVAGMDIIEVNTSLLGDHNARLIDTSQFGWEAQKYVNDIRDYREENKDQTVYKIRNRLGWAATDADANVLLEG